MRAALALLGALALGGPTTSADTQPAGDTRQALEPLRPPTRIVYGGDAEFPPYEFLDDQGRPSGLNIDLIAAIAAAAGFDVEFDLRSWNQIRAGILEGKYDVAAMYRSPQRAREVDFAIPHELIYHEMFIRRGAPGLRALGDLESQRVIVQRDTYAEDVLTELGFGRNLIAVPSEPAALRALAEEAGDVAVVTQTPGRPFQSRAALAPGVVASGPPVLLTEYAFVTRKRQRHLIETLNAGVASLKASGEYERLYDRWIRPDPSAHLLRRTGWALGGALVLMAGAGVWTYTLRRRVAHQTESLRHEFQERARAEQALAQAEHQLRQSQKMEAIGRLAGGVAHDFNNVLTVILNYGVFVRERLVEEHLPTQDADEILAATERAMRLTKPLLAFSRASPLQAEHLDLRAVVHETRTMLQRLVGEHIALEVRTADEPVVARADLLQIEQILLNLVANARDAMTGGGTLVVDVAVRSVTAGTVAGLSAGEYAAIAVIDTGVGMDQETMARIFEPFFTTKAPGRGTGIGLATVFDSVSALGGRVSVASELGVGTTVTVFLPLGAASGVAPLQGTAKAPSRPVAGQRVLLVEDDDALRRAARLALDAAGHVVFEARDGTEAGEILARLDHVDVLVTDVVMPRRSGPQLVADALRLRPSLRVLFISGYVHESHDIDLGREGTAFLPKPYTPLALVEAVTALVAGRPALPSATA